MIVRVGKNGYRRERTPTGDSTRSIADRVERRVARSKRNVFMRADFAHFGSYNAVGHALRKLVEAGRLVRIGSGLYARADISPLSGKPAPVIGISRLAAEALTRLGKKVEDSSFGKAYASGKSTQVPTGRTVAVKGRVRRRIGYDGKYIVFERT